MADYQDTDYENEALTGDETSGESEFLRLARDAHQQSERFIESGLVSRWSRNYALARSEHPQGSKYHSEAFKYRSQGFRGKTEASLRKNEAAFAVAMFSNRDVVSVTPENASDEVQDAGAKGLHALVNYRLNSRDFKWFLLSVGAYHEAQTAGVVVSEQYWDYYKNESGEIEADNPHIELYPPENVKISPHANWLDPINSSPYVIVEIPMFIGDIKLRMEDDWEEYSDSEIQRASNKFKRNAVKAAREGSQQDAAKGTSSPAVTDFDVVYVHKNFIRKDGEDLFYFTLGTELLLSEPVPVLEQYPHLKKGKRPFSWGCVTVEPHKVYPRSMVDRVATTQSQSNDLANLRMDNVRQVLNKRKYAKRGMGVDYKALTNSIPGQTILMDDVNAVKTEETPDVTGSSYQEQHMLNADFDELAGSFSQASVSTNRQLNDTVGGMQLIQGSANTLTEYQLRVFVETWVEDVVCQIADMEQFYEDDAVVGTIAGEGMNNESLQVPADVRVSVGFGSTDPQQKIQKLVFGLNAVKELPGIPQSINSIEVAEEVFGALGYNDGKKFFGEQQEDPRVQQLMEENQQLKQAIETDQVKIQGQMKLEQLKQSGRLQEKTLEVGNDRQLALIKMAIDRGIKVKDIENRAGADERKLNLGLLQELNRHMRETTQKEELSYKMRTGNEGI